MTQWEGKSRNPKFKWKIKAHDDGTLSVNLSLTGLRASAVRSRSRFQMADIVTTLPIDWLMEGFEVHPKLILKLYAKLSPSDRLRWSWGRIRQGGLRAGLRATETKRRDS